MVKTTINYLNIKKSLRSVEKYILVLSVYASSVLSMKQDFQKVKRILGNVNV